MGNGFVVRRAQNDHDPGQGGSASRIPGGKSCQGTGAVAGPRLFRQRGRTREVGSVTVPLDVSGSEIQAKPDAALEGMSRRSIEGRSLGQIAWLRLRRDKVAMSGGVFVMLLILAAIFAPVLVSWFGHPPNDF